MLSPVQILEMNPRLVAARREALSSPSDGATPEAISEARRRLMLTDEQAARSYELRQFIQLRPQLLEAEVRLGASTEVARGLFCVRQHKEEDYTSGPISV